MKNNVLRSFFFPALVVLWLLLWGRHPAWGQALPAAPVLPTTPHKPLAAGNELSLKTLNGQPARLGARPGKVVVVYLWASWCPPCQAALPQLEALARETDSTKVAVVLVALDADADRVRAALASSANALPVYLAAAPVPDAFAPPVLPAVVVLNPSGQVAARYERPGGYDTPAFKATLQKLAQ